MQREHRTVVGIFSDITDAKRAADDLHAQGISAARLVENDQAITFTGTAERESSGGGVKGFFARLFGFEDRSDWKLSSDSETYFQEAYDKKHHIVVIEDCSDVELARAIITRMGGSVEEKGSHYYHSERARPLDRDESLDSGRRSSVDHAADSGLGVDVDRMPFAQAIPVREGASDDRPTTVSDRMDTPGQKPEPRADRALNGISGDADRTPLVGIQSPTDRPLGTRIVGDDRVHDRGVSNADVSRISSDRIMELDDDDQHLTDSTTGKGEGSRDNGHILPDRTYTPAP